MFEGGGGWVREGGKEATVLKDGSKYRHDLQSIITAKYSPFSANHLPQSPFTGNFCLDDAILHCGLYSMLVHGLSQAYTPVDKVLRIWDSGTRIQCRLTLGQDP